MFLLPYSALARSSWGQLLQGSRRCDNHTAPAAVLLLTAPTTCPSHSKHPYTVYSCPGGHRRTRPMGMLPSPRTTQKTLTMRRLTRLRRWILHPRKDPGLQRRQWRRQTCLSTSC